jgi:hypothetical protein
MGNDFTEYIGFAWRQVNLCVKILVVSVVLFVLVQSANLISFYINVNSGGLETLSGDVFFGCFYGLIAFLLLFCILFPLCFIISLIKIDEPINIFLTVVAVVIAVASFKGEIYLRINQIQRRLEPGAMRSVGCNIQKGRTLREYGLELVRLKKDKDFVFTEQFLEENATNHILFLANSRCVLNSYLVDKKSSQIPDDVIVIFESTVPRDKGYIGGPNDISTWWHYGKGSLMVFGDGRVEFVRAEDFNNLRWKP